MQQEVINTIKFITDVNNSNDINLVLDNISIVRVCGMSSTLTYEKRSFVLVCIFVFKNASEDDFSLKMIIEGMENKESIEKVDDGEENNGIHPLLKRISEERWFPRGNLSITLDYVLDAIIEKLPNASKTTLKILTAHLVQLHW